VATEGCVQGFPNINGPPRADLAASCTRSAERAFTYVDLYALLENEDTVARLTPHVVVAREEGGKMVYSWIQLRESCRFYFIADGKEIVASACSSPEHLLEISNVVLLLLAVSAIRSVTLHVKV
jgi:hypothetical protein